MGTEPVSLEHIPEVKRAQIESWWAHCRDQNHDEEEYAYFLDVPDRQSRSRPDGVAAFLAPFDWAPPVVERFTAMLQVWAGATARQPSSEETLLAALQDYLDEFARNVEIVGEGEIADRLRAVADLKVVDMVPWNPTEYRLENEVLEVLQIAVNREMVDHEDRAVKRFYDIIGEWLHGIASPLLECSIVQPLMKSTLDFSAYYRLWALGVDSQIRDTEAIAGAYFNPSKKVSANSG